MPSILIVEDDFDLREVIVDHFRLKGFETTEAENGFDALVNLRGKKFDAILSDIEMPQMDGILFLKIANILWPEIPFFIMTAKPDIFFDEPIIEISTRGHFDKLIGIETIGNFVSETLANPIGK